MITKEQYQGYVEHELDVEDPEEFTNDYWGYLEEGGFLVDGNLTEDAFVLTHDSGKFPTPKEVARWIWKKIKEIVDYLNE